jgi:hypothetical protein
VKTQLPKLPLAPWKPTKETLHLLTQIVGKIRMSHAPKRNHWWHVTLRVSPRGLTTGLVPHPAGAFEIEIDLVGHGLEVRGASGAGTRLPLRDGVPLAETYAAVLEALAALHVKPRIKARPYDVRFSKQPFTTDRRHHAYAAQDAARFAEILRWTAGVMERFAGGFEGKTSPVQLFWHSFDLAVTRFSGRRAPPIPGANAVTREAYSHEVASFGFWPGDDDVKEPAYYAYAAPVAKGLRDHKLAPRAARWNPEGGMALLPYEAVRRSSTPERTLLSFYDSVFQAARQSADWDAVKPGSAKNVER